jgi:Domain of unknown function (DU1801)
MVEVVSAPFRDPKVKAVFDAYPAKLRAPLMALREMILNTAAQTDGVGKLTETLKWGEPAYLPVKSGIGTTVRINALKGSTDRYAMFVNCQTTLVADFRELYADTFELEGRRAVILKVGQRLPGKALRHCIALALTYHARK